MKFFAQVLAFFVLQGVSAVHVDIEPLHAVVLPGRNISVLCRTGVPLAYCRVALPALGSLNLNKASRYNRDYQYFGTGLDNGQCGVTFPSVTENYDGHVYCGVGTHDEAFESSNVMTLVVAKSPETPEMGVSLSETRSNEYSEGETFWATCIVKDGRPAANITWFLGDDEIYDGLSMPVVTENSRTGLDTVTQTLRSSLTWRDNGKALKCVGGHLAYGNKRNYTTEQIYVRYAPRDVKLPIRLSGFAIGRPGVVSVEILANPEPTFAWVVGNVRLEEREQDATGKFRARNLEFTGGGKYKATLLISCVTAEDIAREYFLHAKNVEGERRYRIVISTSSQSNVVTTDKPTSSGVNTVNTNFVWFVFCYLIIRGFSTKSFV